ncbi:AAA family ATPase [Micromonospora peucetia]|uniref:AAA family ATPase n=1 Tax=Micromonospora peucetia TaxID=47871 RepID=UPI003318C782
MRTAPPLNARSTAFLITDNWNDWYEFRTQYYLIYCDDAGNRLEVGSVKIGQFGMRSDQDRPDLPDAFAQLDERFFSLGQDEGYYQNLTQVSEDFRDRVLQALGDVARDQDLFRRARSERVLERSLMRDVPAATVQGQFRRLARGYAKLSRYAFSYLPPGVTESNSASRVLSFTVEPESEPPTNIHVLIGRNGVGKTRILNQMAHALVGESVDADQFGRFRTDDLDNEGVLFSRLVSVSFSAFDQFSPPTRLQQEYGVRDLRPVYIGLKTLLVTGVVGRRSERREHQRLKSAERLGEEFASSIDELPHYRGRLSRWKRALEMLEADPIFADAEVAGLADDGYSTEDRRESALQLFDDLSTGHKIVLLMTTKLVESVEERTLVLIDEPESHLHPPLLSAFIRALSDLLVSRNGVAIVATHSPVVLQEVPRNCAWFLQRSGRELRAERPELETFGENISVLTREVFGFEVTRTGFHRLLIEAADDAFSYEEIVDRFGGQLGAEAKAILRVIMASRRGRGGA